MWSLVLHIILCAITARRFPFAASCFPTGHDQSRGLAEGPAAGPGGTRSGVLAPLAKARRLIWPTLSVHKVGTRTEVFRGSLGGPPVPLSTLHPRCRHRRRMTRGQRSSLNFHCGALSSPTPRRFIPALSDRAPETLDTCTTNETSKAGGGVDHRNKTTDSRPRRFRVALRFAGCSHGRICSRRVPAAGADASITTDTEPLLTLQQAWVVLSFLRYWGGWRFLLGCGFSLWFSRRSVA